MVRVHINRVTWKRLDLAAEMEEVRAFEIKDGARGKEEARAGCGERVIKRINAVTISRW